MSKEKNFYDNLSVDVKRLYKEFPTSKAKSWNVGTSSQKNYFSKIYKNFLIPQKIRNYLWYLLRRTGIDTFWCDEFKLYWSKVLHGRTLWGTQDFYFLRSVYRTRFKDNYVPSKANSKTHLKAWQHKGLLYQLFHQVYKESLSNKIEILKDVNAYKKKEVKTLLEYGCANAPITTTLFEFYNPKKMKIYIADIETLSFHYAVYKFRHNSNVSPIALKPKNDFLLDFKGRVDVIFCIEVFEHLNKPLETVKIFHKILNKSGLLFFDYIKCVPGGLNTTQGSIERDKVIDFISKKFKVVKGAINKDKNTYQTIVRKK